MEYVWREILYAIGGIIGVLIAFVVTKYLIPWLKTKLGESKFNYILEQIHAFMSAAEENSNGMTGPEKCEWVIDQIVAIFPRVSRSYIKALIDGSMRALELDGIVNYHKKGLND